MVVLGYVFISAAGPVDDLGARRPNSVLDCPNTRVFLSASTLANASQVWLPTSGDTTKTNATKTTHTTVSATAKPSDSPEKNMGWSWTAQPKAHVTVDMLVGNSFSSSKSCSKRTASHATAWRSSFRSSHSSPPSNASEVSAKRLLLCNNKSQCSNTTAHTTRSNASIFDTDIQVYSEQAEARHNKSILFESAYEGAKANVVTIRVCVAALAFIVSWNSVFTVYALPTWFMRIAYAVLFSGNIVYLQMLSILYYQVQFPCNEVKSIFRIILHSFVVSQNDLYTLVGEYQDGFWKSPFIEMLVWGAHVCSTSKISVRVSENTKEMTTNIMWYVMEVYSRFFVQAWIWFQDACVEDMTRFFTGIEVILCTMPRWHHIGMLYAAMVVFYAIVLGVIGNWRVDAPQTYPIHAARSPPVVQPQLPVNDSQQRVDVPQLPVIANQLPAQAPSQ